MPRLQGCCGWCQHSISFGMGIASRIAAISLTSYQGSWNSWRIPLRRGVGQPMHEDNTAVLQSLIDRMRQGDPQARRDLLERAHGRLRKLASRILSDSFPALRARHDLDSVVDEAWIRLVQALDRTDPPTVADFFRLAAHKMRQVLLDMADRQRRRREVVGSEEAWSGGPLPADPAGQTYDPARLALWTELQEKVAALPEQERAVFEMHFYLGLPQAEIARVLDLHPRKVSYLWVAATERLAEGLSESEDLM
jgi:RNA polymerase sigma factor (sigma-70 family)